MLIYISDNNTLYNLYPHDMTEVIDLTNDDIVIAPERGTTLFSGFSGETMEGGHSMNVYDLSNNPIETPSTRQYKYKCSYCKTPGHNVRNCVAPEIVDLCMQIRQNVNQYNTIENVILWLETYDVKILRVVASKYSYTNYRKSNTKEMCINILRNSIISNYETIERNNRNRLQNSLYEGRFLGWINETTIIPNAYREYCENSLQYRNEEISEEEIGMLSTILHTRTVPISTPYRTVKRFYDFLLYKYLQSRPSILPPMQYSSLIIDEQKQIDCPICMESISAPNIFRTLCKHDFCENCIKLHINTDKTKICNCPLCRAPVTILQQLIFKEHV